MAERRLIYNAKGVQLGYLEDNVAFDLSGRQRCNYNGASGNLVDLNSETVIGHVSLDGIFVGASWISDDLFGKPTGEASANRIAANRPTGMRDFSRRNRPSAKRSDTLPAASGLEQSVDNPAPPAQPALQSDGERETDLNGPEISPQELEEPSEGHRGEAAASSELTTPSPPADELLSRAIGMIRDALAKE